MDKNKLYRNIPKVDQLLEDNKIQKLISEFGRDVVIEAIRTELNRLREYIGRCTEEEAGLETAQVKERIEKRVLSLYTPNMKKVFNATGVILHTNLGRSPLSPKHVEQITKIMSGYSNLEYNLENGERGERYSHFEELLCRITGAEAAMAVNNNAASVLLILNALADGGEVIVSRGELVEIGGNFRIPEVMKISGAKLVEIGTTNKTHLEDYEAAVTQDTKAVLKVHTSNYKIIGFTESVEIEKLSAFAKGHGFPVIEDIGSGVFINLEHYGLAHEPTVQEVLKKGADVVCFSGDKLLGGPQAGIIVGRKKYIERIKKNQLTRALRIDKFTAAALELVLQEYLSEEKAVENIPVLRMITKKSEEISREAEELCEMLKKENFEARIEVVSCESRIGGGSLPTEVLKGKAVSLMPEEISVSKLESRMRRLTVPVIARISDHRVLLDVRTLDRSCFEEMIKMFQDAKIFKAEGHMEEKRVKEK